ncbi:MAG: VCBS repeat-containing protein [Pirellulales bacterium]|nr:VCBS repeat-containing protein [Pirellulales bacterium]
MMIWDAVRRFSGIGKRGKSSRPLQPTRSHRRELTGSLRGRDLRVEQFEDRVLLSISPTGLDDLGYFSSSVINAIERVTDLNTYDTNDLNAVREWVVGLSGSALSNPRNYAASMQADYLGPTTLLANTSIWEFSEYTDAQTIIDTLDSATNVLFAYPLVGETFVPLFMPNDTLFSEQWHLINTGQSGGTPEVDANVEVAWDYVTGAGIVIGVVDDGVEVEHPDLAANMRLDLSHDWADGDDDPTPPPGEDGFFGDNYAHGTSVAGVAAGVGNNDLGISGAAPNANIAGLRLDYNQDWTDTMLAGIFSHQNQEIDIYNNSWGPTGGLYTRGPLTMAALENAVLNGRDGLGNIITFAAGNSREEGDNVNLNQLANSRYTIAVAALNHNGTYSSYSTPGASLLISAPSSDIADYETVCGIYTTDRVGDEGYNTELGPGDDDPLNDLNYTSTFGGTSSATPLVSGVIALILEANPGLTYRDVQHILVETAVKNDATSTEWALNGAGYHVSHDYGFGLVDAEAAVQTAAAWTNVGPERSDSSGVIQVDMAIPDGSTINLSSTTTLDNTVDSIEWVEVTFDATHDYPGDLEVILVSPSGTESRLAEVNTNSWYYYDWAGYAQWTFTTARCWGESALGEWTLKVRDGDTGGEGIWNSWELKVYGQNLNGEDPGQQPSTVSYWPELVAVLPNEGDKIHDGDSLQIAPRELTFQFNERQEIDPETVGAIRIVRSGGDNVIGNANDIPIEYGWIGIGELPNEVVVRFADALPDDLYHITIIGDGPAPLTNIQGAPFHEGQNQSLEFDLDLGAQIIAVVPQPTSRDASGNLQQSRDTIEVYFNDDELAYDSVTNTSFYRLAKTQESANPGDDEGFNPISVTYDPVANKVILTFADDLAKLTSAGTNGGTGAFHLRIGNEYREIPVAAVQAELVADTFGAAYNTADIIGSLGGVGLAESLIISSIIEPQPYDLVWPGSLDEPGHRELPSAAEIEAHYGAGYYAGDSEYGVARFYYNFKQNLGGSFKNIITNTQKQRAREIFELYGDYLGIEFIEDTTGTRGFTVATGDMRVLDPYIPTGPGGVIGLAGGGIAIMDGAETLLWGDSEYGGAWFRTAMHEIGHLLGLGHTYDLPAYTVMGSGEQPEFEDLGSVYYLGSSEAILPGQEDLIHGLHIYRPDSTDVDVYEFTLDANGVFSAEITAERRENSSLLDSLMTIYDADGQMIARNDDYYSEDSYIELELHAGKYYVAISSTGNDEFDLNVPGSGIGGTSQGEYDLRLTFLPKLLSDGTGGVDHLVDTTGTRFDGDANGVPGGVYNFWFNVQQEEDTLFVDKIAATGGDGSLAHPFRNIDDALAVAQPNQIVRIVGNHDRTFLDQVTYDVGVNPNSVAVGDFDGDGLADIVSTSEFGETVNVLFRHIDGTVRALSTYNVGKVPAGVAVGDLNGDGALDIIVANSGSANVSILYNNGNGTFANQVTRFAGSGATAVSLADLDGDDKLDIVVANKNDDNVGVLLSSEAAIYADQVVYPSGNAPHALALADVNNDLAVDIIVANAGDAGDPASAGISVLLNNGDGTFGPAVPLDMNAGGDTVPNSVAVADMDGDGMNDIIAALVINAQPDVVAIYSGAGDGTFAAGVHYVTGNNPKTVGVADLDADGVFDIVTSNSGDNNVSVLFGIVGGTLESPINYAVGTQPRGLALADLDGDTRPDIVTTNYANQRLSVLLARRDKAYEIGQDLLQSPLEDGWRMEIPKGVTVMVDAGAVFKLRWANIDVGSSSHGIDRSEGALQILGTPEQSVYFTSFHDKSIGEDHAAPDLFPMGSDWGGLVFRNDLDYDTAFEPGTPHRVLETEGIFLNYVNHAEFRYGGGQVMVNGQTDVYNPIHMIEARPTISHNLLLYSADAAMSADPASFADTKYHGFDETTETYYTNEYERIGPKIHGNRLMENSMNGLFVRIDTEAGQPIRELEVPARWDDTDIVHIVSENLFISGTPGGPTVKAGVEGLIARPDARLKIDPGIFVKLDHGRFEVEMGAQLIAEGLPGYPIVFTSLFDDRYGAGGTFDTTSNEDHAVAAPGDWGGIYFSPISKGSIDEALIAYAGGVLRIEGDTDAVFNPIEIHQADVRLTNSSVEDCDSSLADPTDDRNGRGTIVPAAIFIRGAQLILIDNVIRDNNGPAISVDANSLTADYRPDSGRSSNFLSAFEGYPDNYGPLVRENRLHNNTLDGMVIRGAVLTTESVWDDSDITHILLDEIVVPNFHTYGGLRLQSGLDESLVVKLSGESAGITALGTPQEITDRIGGTLQIIGTPGYPVVMTSLADDSVGAGVDPWGQSQRDADNVNETPVPGSWRGITLERYVNDRNVEIIREWEGAAGSTADLNGNPIKAQIVGQLASLEHASDDNLRLGFDIRGFIRDDDPTDKDVYGFTARAGTEVWIDIDRTTLGLDSIIELIDANGNVLASSDDSCLEEGQVIQPGGIARLMNRDTWDINDMYTTNPHDAGMRLILPGAGGELRTYYVQVRSVDGASSGAYELQIRLQELQEIAGSTIRNASIRYAVNGIELVGLPVHSPILGETTEVELTTTYYDQIELDGQDNDIIVTAIPGSIADQGRTNIYFTANTGVGAGAIATYLPPLQQLSVQINPGVTTAQAIINAINNVQWNGAFAFTAQLDPSEVDNDPYGLIAPIGTVIETGWVGVTGNGVNDILDGAEPLGNILQSDRAAVLVGGYISDAWDVDWYSFNIDLDQVQGTGNIQWPTIFDLDYADGMGRPELTLYVYDSDYKLVYTNSVSNVDDDQPGPTGSGVDDLMRGSAGVNDPLIGPVRLLAGESGPDPEDENIYYVAVVAAGNTARAQRQDVARREPVNSIVRINEDHLQMSMMSGVNTETSILWDTSGGELNVHVDDHHLNDVVLFVSTGSDLITIDPLTGTLETDVTGPNVLLPDSPVIQYGDLAMRNDGRLMSIVQNASVAGDRNPFNGSYRELSTGDGSLVIDNDDGIVAYHVKDTSAEKHEPGLTYHAIVPCNGDTQRRFWAVATSTADVSGTTWNNTNLIYLMDAEGNAIKPPNTKGDDRLPSKVLPYFWLDTRTAAGITDPNEPTPQITGLTYVDGTLIAVDDGGRVYKVTGMDNPNGSGGFTEVDPDSAPKTVEYPSGGDSPTSLTLLTVELEDGTTGNDLATLKGYTSIEFSGLALGPQNIEDGAYASTLFATAAVDEGGAQSTRIFAFTIEGNAIVMAPVFVDTQSDITLVDPDGNPLGFNTTGLAFSNIDYNLWHMTSNRGDGGADDEVITGLNEPGHGIEIAPDDSRTPPFYRESGSSSFWFGLEYGMPGTVNAYDYGSRVNSDALDTYDIPGGANGALTTDAFSLVGYEAADQPTIFFNYYLDTYNNPANQPNPYTDSIRVYISVDGANWEMLASNIPNDGVTLLRDSIPGTSPNPVPDFVDADKDADPNIWRQAMIGLGSYVGLDNLRLRFEFDTAASVNVGVDYQGQQTFLRAVPAWGIYDGAPLDGQRIIISDPLDPDPNYQVKYFEIDMGYTLVAPNSAGRAIPDGESFTITGPTELGNTATILFEFDKDNHLYNTPGSAGVDMVVALPISNADSASTVAELITNVVSNVFIPTDDPDNPDKFAVYAVQNDSWVLFSSNIIDDVDADGLTQDLGPNALPGATEPVMVIGSRPGVESNNAGDTEENYRILIEPDMTAAQVAEQIALVLDQELAVKDIDGNSMDVPDLFTSVKLNEDLIQFMTMSDGMPIPSFRQIIDAGVLGYGLVFPGEGEAPQPGSPGTNFTWNLRGQDNNFEGFYLDDVVIGFIERGQMFTDMNPSRDMRPRQPSTEITEGYYQLEIRTASEYGTGVWDTNDRHTEVITIEAPSATQIVHRQTFVVYDGVNSQTFQFIAEPGDELNPTFLNVEPDEGAIAIFYQHGETATEIAEKITDAINNAASIKTMATMIATSNRVELADATSVENMDSLVFSNDGEHPVTMELLDLNPPLDPTVDPITDVVTVNEFDGTVTVYIDNISSFTKYDVGYLPSDLAIDDIDNDGFLDLVVSNSGDDTVSILLGNANIRGTFESQIVFGVGHNPSGVAVFDLDGDGNLDIVTSNKSDNTVSILYGLGDGNFFPGDTVAVGLAPLDVAAGDIDNDGMGDIVTANSGDNTVSLLKDVGGGIYALSTYQVGRMPVAVVLAELDPDQPANPDDPPPPQWLDILTADRVDGTLTVLMNDRAGGFGDPRAYDAGESPVNIHIDDENGDGRPDAFVANYSSNQASILIGTANAQMMFQAPQSYSVVQYGPSAAGFGDLDGDFIPDLVTSNYRTSTITILPGAFGYNPMFAIVIGTGDDILRLLQGDENRFRDQGQVIIAANEVLYSAEYGIKAAPAERDSWPHTGSTAPLREVNQKRLVPGLTIENNLVVGSGEAGIYFGGDYETDAPDAAVPFGRIINNTVYGGDPVSNEPLLDIELLDPINDNDFNFKPVLNATNNDWPSVIIPIGFDFNFAGEARTDIYVNVNGSVSFNQGLYAVDENGFPAGLAAIAPFWADVDARSQGDIYISTGTSVRGNPVFQVDWYDVGYSNNNVDKTNNFTLYLEDDPDGDIIAFFYKDLQWTTGDEDGGTNGFFGTGAIVGMSSGDNSLNYELARPWNQNDLDDLVEHGLYVYRLDPVSGLPDLINNVGIEIGPNASPTLLNNIVADLTVGILIDSTATPVIGATVYQKNDENVVGGGLGQYAMLLTPDEPLFVDAEEGNFYMAKGSRAIDSSVDSLPDRPSMIAVRDPLGIGQSPILAPELDLYGQLRSDDPSAEPPSGFGSNVFKDRGAIDRVDFYVPMANLIYPLDNDPAGLDRNLAQNDVFIAGDRLELFTISLVDTTGAGIDDVSVKGDAVQIFKDSRPVPLTQDVDYFFHYDAGTDLITLVPASGLWEEATVYTIVLDNGPDGIRDIAGNALRPNRLDNTTKFVIAHSEFDFGDVSAEGYPTMLAQDGARHLLIGDWYLGEGVTGETDANLAHNLEGQVIVNSASGDAKDDGVVFDSWLLAGEQIGVTVTASRGDGMLDAWIDFDGDGVWEPEEKIFDHLHLTRGEQELVFQVPADTTTKTTFARFRYTQNGVDLPTGEALNGEVEDYLVKIVEKLQDFGDAPSPYPTLQDEGGAYHEIDMAVGLWMGQSVDQEFDGQPHLAAMGDDLVGEIVDEAVVNDEDGVEFLDYLVPGEYFSINVNTSRSGGYLNAWIDYNADSVWSEDEQIANGILLDAGDNIITISQPIPLDAVLGATFARFRLSTVEDLEPTGRAPDGEVEDYRVLVSTEPRDFGDAPRSFSTKAEPEPATALVVSEGENNDLFLTATTPGEDFNDVKIFIVNSGGVEGNLAFVNYNATAKNLIIDVDPEATRANTVIDAINAEGTFHADRDTSIDTNNDGTGLMSDLGRLATTADGHDGFGEDSANHMLALDLWLGPHVDVEIDAYPDDEALGDDHNGIDDEDGIVDLPERFIAGKMTSFTANVHMGQATEAYLNAWIDYNLDGVWTENEHVIQAMPVQDGPNSIDLAVPITASSGLPYARFRLSTEPNLSFSGQAPDGEIEDYRFEIAKGNAAISGWVFDDRDNDSTWDALEKGVAGVTVYIDLDNNGVLDPGDPAMQTMVDDLSTVDIDETGLYRFEGLLGRAEAYTVRQITPDDSVQTYPNHAVVFPDGSSGNEDGSYTIFLEESEIAENVTFGNYRRAHVTISDVAVAEGHEGFKEVQVTLTLSGSFGAPVELHYQTADGTATLADNDYLATSGTFTFGAQNTPAPSWEKLVLTDNATNDYDYQVSGDYVVWEGYDGHDWEIYLFHRGDFNPDGSPTIITLTDNETDDTFASVFDTGTGANVVWIGKDEIGEGQDDEIWFHHESLAGQSYTKQLGNNTFADKDPQVSGSHVVWWANDGLDTEIFMVDIASIQNTPDGDIAPLNLSDNLVPDTKPRISGSNVVWTGTRNNTTEVFVYAGEVDDYGKPILRRVTSNARPDDNPEIDGNRVVWESKIDTYEIFLYDIETDLTTQVTANTQDDRYPQISGSDIVWQSNYWSDWDIFHYNAEAQTAPVDISQTTLAEERPEIADGRVVWRVFTGTNWEVYSYELRSGGTAQNISNSTAYEHQPQTSGSLVVWRSHEGGDYEIVVAEAHAPVISQTITVRIVGDMKTNPVEPDEQFYLMIDPLDPDVVVIDDPDIEIKGATPDQNINLNAGTIYILNDDGPRDFGDAPDPDYPTLLVNNGARHLISPQRPGLRLGSLIDVETDGKPGTLANGDDTSTSDDEDGVAFTTIFGQGATATISVNVSEGNSYLDAWIDFNVDGDWDDPGEHIFDGELMVAGANVLPVDVPITAAAGYTYARFRLSSIGHLNYTGQAPDGEVEDYRVEISARPAVVNRTVTLPGTSGNDVFVLTADDDSLQVTINGASYGYLIENVDLVKFDGGAGTDTVIMHGSDGSESVELWSSHSEWIGAGAAYRVEVTNVESTLADGGNGVDTALMHDTAQKDTLVGYPTEVTLSGLGYSLKTTDMETVEVRSQLGGEDTADLYDSAEADVFIANPSQGEIGRLGQVVGGVAQVDPASPYHIIASGFRYLRGHADAGGYDRAQFTDSPQEDTFTGSPTVSTLVGQGFHLEARTFEYVKATATASGTDHANMYDSAGDEIFTSRPADTYNKSFAELKAVDNSFIIRTEAFRYASASAAEGGDDKAIMYASAGEDTLEARPTSAKLTGANFLHKVDYFPTVTVYGNLTGNPNDSGGGNVAKLFDSTGDDFMSAGANQARLWGDGFDIKVNFFSNVTAYSNYGGFDTATLSGSVGFDTYVGNENSGSLFREAAPGSPGYYYEAFGFQKVIAEATPGEQDIAYLYDIEAMVDLLEADKPAGGHGWVRLSNTLRNVEHYLTDFATVRAHGSTSGDIKDVTDAVDFLIATGTWQDI